MEVWSYYRVLRRWRWLIAAAMGVAVAVMAALYHPGAGDYSASATLLVPTAQNNSVLPGAGTATGVDLGAEALGFIWSEEAASRVIQRLDLPTTLYQLHLRLTAVKDPVNPLIRITMTGRTPEEAIALANAMADAATEYAAQVHRGGFTAAREFLELQTATARTNLAKAEAALLSFQQRNEFALSENRTAQISGLQTELQQTLVALNEAEAKLAQTVAEMRKQSPTASEQEIAGNPVAQQLRSTLAGLDVDLISERAVHTARHPDVVALQVKIQAVKDRLRPELERIVSATRTVRNPVYDALTASRASLEADKVALQAKREALQRFLQDSKEQMPGLARMQVEESRLSRNVASLNKVVEDLQTQLAVARSKEQTAQALGGLAVVDRATVAIPNPFHEQRVLFTLALVLGLLLGTGLAFALEYLDNRVRTPERAERLLGLPVLVAVPRHNPPFPEAYRMLRANLSAHEGDEGGDILALTGVKPGVGTSTVVASLARAYAQTGRHTIVVDAALREPAQQRLLDVPSQQGLAEVLTRKISLRDALAPTGIPNLSLLSSGGVADAEEIEGLLASKAMTELVAELRRLGAVVLIDLPAAGVFADAFNVAPHVAGVVLVVAADQIPRGVEEQVKTQLERGGAKVLGVALTKVRPDLVTSYFYQTRARQQSPRVPAPITMLLLGFFITSGVLAGLAAAGYIAGAPLNVERPVTQAFRHATRQPGAPVPPPAAMRGRAPGERAR